MPTVEFSPVTPLTRQETWVLPVPETVAVNCRVDRTRRLALEGEMVTDTEVGPTTVTLADPVAADSATDAACTVTVARFGGKAGAVYSPTRAADSLSLSNDASTEEIDSVRWRQR